VDGIDVTLYETYEALYVQRFSMSGKVFTEVERVGHRAVLLFTTIVLDGCSSVQRP
jgi:hypothetical protein